MAERSRPGTSPPPESAGPFASSWRRRHLTVDERVARGLAARQEAQPSVLERFLGSSTYSHHGERVVAGQRLMQAATDIFLGWQRIKGETFDRAIADFSAAYADQNERDYAAFAAAVDSGRLVARTGV